MNIAQTMPATDDSAKYETERLPGTVVGYVQNGRFVDSGDIPTGDQIALVLDKTCFYGEQGGQVGDIGRYLRDLPWSIQSVSEKRYCTSGS